MKIIELIQLVIPLCMALLFSGSCNRSAKKEQPIKTEGSEEAQKTAKVQESENNGEPGTHDHSKKIDFSKAIEKNDDKGNTSGICKPQEVLCGETVEDCVDVTTSIQNCGKCGRRCFNNQQCTEGHCTGVGVITPPQLKKAMKNKDFLLINVRVPPIAIIPGTDKSIPHNKLESLVEAIGKDLNKRVILYCGTSTRIKVALRLLREKGYKNISVLENGVRGWMAAGFSTESD